MVCGSSQFIISYFHFCILLYTSRSLDFLFLNVLGSPWADIEFFVVILSSFLKTTAPITQTLCPHVTQRIRCRCFAFLQHVATHSHSHPLAISNFIWAGSPGMPNEIHIFFSQIRCSHGSHEPSTMDRISHTRSFSRSFSLNLLMLNRVLHREQNSRVPQMTSRTGIPRLARWLS